MKGTWLEWLKGKSGWFKMQRTEVPFLPTTFWTCMFIYLIGLSVTSKPFQTWNWKPRHFFYTTEYHYCITGSGSNCHQLLAALGRRKKTHHFNHQTSRGSHPLSIRQPVDIRHFNHQTSRGYSLLQSPNLPWKPPTINQATGGSHPLSIRQPVDNTWPGTWFLYLPHQLTPPSSTAKDKWTHILLHPFWAWHPPIQPRGLDMAI